MTTQYKIMFCGMDEHTFKVLAESPYIKLAAVNRLQDFEGFKSCNPVDVLFKQVYKLIQAKSNILSSLLMYALRCSRVFGSRITKKYFSYLDTLQKNAIDIVDISNVDEAVNYIKKNQIDLMVVNNWWMLPDNIIYAPRLGTLNIHPSLLPAYRGSIPTLWSLKHKDKSTAVTFMLLNAEVDGGDILKQHIIPIEYHDDSITLEDNCNKTIAKYLINDIKDYLEGKIKPSRQDISKASRTARYFDYQKIDWETELSKDIIDKIKLYPYAWPLDKCYTYFKNRRVEFHHAQRCQGPIPSLLLPGTGIVKGRFLYVKAIDGIIKFNLFADVTLINAIRFLDFGSRIINFKAELAE